jgi:hypothetical protein
MPEDTKEAVAFPNVTISAASQPGQLPAAVTGELLRVRDSDSRLSHKRAF